VHKPDMLHTIYLGLYKHMMDWIQGFLKKHSRQQAFDDAWKAVPSYPGFFVPKKACREVTQWQGKDMRDLGACLLGVLAVELRQADSTQVQPFRRALTCVRSLLDFTIMAQYQSHTPETISYMEETATQFQETKDIFLEFCISKRTQEKAHELRKELWCQRAQMRARVPPSQPRWIRDDDRQEQNDQSMELIHSESNFNLLKMHLISHFRDHIYMFGNIPMYSTEDGELAHKEQMKDEARRSNKIDAARLILSSYGRQHAIRMRMLNLEFLQRAGADLPTEVVEHLEKTRTAPTPPAHRRILK